MKRGAKESSTYYALRTTHYAKRAQVTLFVILAIVIVIVSVSIYSFVAKPKVFFKGIEEDPYKYIQLCLEENLTELVDIVSVQGGSLDPEFYYEYHGDKIATLCYTSEYYKTCEIQEPFLKQHIEAELLSGIKSKVGDCFDSLKEDYEEEGYAVELEKKEPKVTLLPERVVLTMDNTILLTKETTTEYSDFVVPVSVDLYTLVGVASSMVEWESAVGDVVVTDFMSIYHDLDIRKTIGTENRKVYTIIKRSSGESFQFASRSLSFPPGLL